MKFYETPDVEINVIRSTDIITVSVADAGGLVDEDTIAEWNEGFNS